MPTAVSRALLFALLVAAGCAAPVPEPSSPGAEGGCALFGVQLAAGESAPAPDKCNTCICTAGGTLACTSRSCAALASDGGVVDAGDDAGVEPKDEGEDLEPPPSPCYDDDRDGFYTCLDEHHPERPLSIDCDDTRFFVQPGGAELPGTPQDDDCDGRTDDATACPCHESADGNDLASALGACGSPVVSATRFGQPRQVAVAPDYFGDVLPRQGACLSALSTGDALSTDTQVSLCSSGTCTSPDPEPGAAATSRVYDLAQLQLVLDVPPNARGFQLDFMFLSSEWPEYLCKVYNDTFTAVVESAAVNGGERTNIAFDPEGRPVTVNVGFFEEPAAWTTPLAATPYGGDATTACSAPSDLQFQSGCALPTYCDEASRVQKRGSGSGWLTASAPVKPGEHGMKLTLSIHDEGDSAYDSLVLLDHFRWIERKPPTGVTKAAR